MRDPADPPTIRTHESRGQGMMLRGIDPTCGVRPAKEECAAGSGAMGMGMGGGMGGKM